MGKKPHRRLDSSFSKDGEWTERKTWEAKTHWKNWLESSLMHFISMSRSFDEVGGFNLLEEGKDVLRRGLLYSTIQRDAYHSFALGAENFFKGIIVLRSGKNIHLNGDKSREDWGKFEYPWDEWKAKERHCLVKLAKQADVGFSEEEVNSLDWYTDFITWKGRYPLPQITQNQISCAVAYASVYGLKDKLSRFFKIGGELPDNIYQNEWNELQGWLSKHCEKVEQKTKNDIQSGKLGSVLSRLDQTSN